MAWNEGVIWDGVGIDIEVFMLVLSVIASWNGTKELCMRDGFGIDIASIHVSFICYC